MRRDKAERRLIPWVRYKSSTLRSVDPQASSVVIPHVHSTDGLGSEDYNFSGVQTLKFLKAPKSRNDLCRHAWELRSRASRRVNMYLSLRAVFLPSSGDNISSQGVQFKRRGSGDIGRAFFLQASRGT